MIIKISGVDFSGSLVDGPGVRSVIYLQGCELHCDGCHNQSTWDENCGIIYNVEDLANEIKLKAINKKVTISGGEPFFQQEATIELVNELKGFNLCIYTGSNFDEVPIEILPYLNYLKVGKYKKNLRTTTIPYIGSTNQKFLTLKDGEIV
jgi:anaerobic ribonucleoside-triphosphate reductase activating protein